MRSTVKATAFALLATAAVGVTAQQDAESSSYSVQKPLVTIEGNYLYISAAGDAFQVSGPDGFFASSDQPYFDFGGEVPDGTYTFTVYMSAGKQGETVSEAENSVNGRQANAAPGQIKNLVASGSFQVIDNSISTEK